MGIRKFRPMSPGTRGRSVSDFSEITRARPEKSLVEPLTKSGGRNHRGHISMRRRGGGSPSSTAVCAIASARGPWMASSAVCSLSSTSSHSWPVSSRIRWSQARSAAVFAAFTQNSSSSSATR